MTRPPLLAVIEGLIDPRRWALWSQPRSFIAYCLIVESAAVVATISAAGRPIVGQDLRLFAVLAGLGIAQAELSRQVERVRRRVTATPHINMSSVWTFAGVLLLPIQLTVPLVAVLYAHLAVRSWYRLRRVPPFRTVFNAALVTVTCLTARAVLAAAGFTHIANVVRHDTSGALAVLGSAAAYFITGALIAVPGLSTRSRSWTVLFGSRAENSLELTTLCLGAMTAVLLGTSPALAVAIVPPMLLLQRSALVAQLETAATTDLKTGLLNVAGWNYLANRELARAARRRDASLGVLMIDLDHFKRINDRYGHLAGDAVLHAVAQLIIGEVRGYDCVGRFGGEEFVVLLPATNAAEVHRIAERIRQAVATLKVDASPLTAGQDVSGLSVSIGLAMYPAAGSGIDRLVHAADTALYHAKTDGRNRVNSYPIAA